MAGINIMEKDNLSLLYTDSLGFGHSTGEHWATLLHPGSTFGSCSPKNLITKKEKLQVLESSFNQLYVVLIHSRLPKDLSE